MCYIIQREIESIIDMQSDLVGDGCMAIPLKEKDYYLEYFIDCQECSRALATVLVESLMEEAYELIEDKGSSLYHVVTDLQVHTYSIQIYSNGSPILDSFLIPVVDKVIHQTTLESVLETISNKYNKTLWL